MKIILLAILLSGNLEAKLIDKIAGVINDKIFTLSEITRIKETIAKDVF